MSLMHLIDHWNPGDDAAHLRTVVRHQGAAGERVGVVVLSANPEARAEIRELGAECFWIRQRWPIDPFAMRELAILLRTQQPGVVHFWGTGAAEFSPLARWALPRARLLATLPAEPASSATGGIRRWFADDRAPLDRIVVDFVPEGLAADPKVVVIPPGVAATPTEDLATRGEVLESLDLPANGRLVVIAGHLTRDQQIDDAIWSYELVRTLHEEACLVVLGEGPDRFRLERQARLMSVPATIRFAPLDAAVLAHADVYWQPGPSRAIPTALLAAVAAGVPTLAEEVPAHAELITPGINGYLVSAKRRAIWTRHTVELLENAPLHAELSAAARKIAENYPLPAMLAAYDELAGLSQRGAAATGPRAGV